MELPSDNSPFSGDELDLGGAPATTDTLRAVLDRHRRRQGRLLGVLAVVVLLAGATAGYAIGDRRGSPGTQLTAGQQPASPAPAAPAAAQPAASSSSSGGFSFSSGGSGSIPSVQLLVRDATDGTRVRLYQQDMSAKTKCAPSESCPQPPPSCMPTSLLTSEVSDDQVAGVAGSPLWKAPPATGFDPISAGVVGNGEPQPILAIVAHSGPEVTKVQLSTTYGTDTETPTSAGWSALALRLPADFQRASADSDVPAGTVTAYAATGAVVGSANLVDISSKPSSPPCQPGCPPDGKPMPPPGSPRPTTSGGHSGTVTSGPSETVTSPGPSGAPPAPGAPATSSGKVTGSGGSIQMTTACTVASGPAA
ncbi:MAG: hypothetical protein ACYDH6_07645 [Acidimicrobiales bacterium]